MYIIYNIIYIIYIIDWYIYTINSFVDDTVSKSKLLNRMESLGSKSVPTK